MYIYTYMYVHRYICKHQGNPKKGNRDINYKELYVCKHENAEQSWDRLRTTLGQGHTIERPLHVWLPLLVADVCEANPTISDFHRTTQTTKFGRKREREHTGIYIKGRCVDVASLGRVHLCPRKPSAHANHNTSPGVYVCIYKYIKSGPV